MKGEEGKGEYGIMKDKYKGENKKNKIRRKRN